MLVNLWMISETDPPSGELADEMHTVLKILWPQVHETCTGYTVLYLLTYGNYATTNTWVLNQYGFRNLLHRIHTVFLAVEWWELSSSPEKQLFSQLMNDTVLDTKCSYFAEAKLVTVNEDQVSESEKSEWWRHWDFNGAKLISLFKKRVRGSWAPGFYFLKRLLKAL